ncbi:venom acid phosphatase Acph-1-like [Ceratina calcarata]|uniref:acid phosphatase n=1 Tax=Ceratina calcarata TaxID=156304 RepID=A0AAJ7WCL4_9HYME|nr:venom acid phosphatase Acph-1-like [Ceratina calcarata]
MPLNPIYDQLGYGQLIEKGKTRELQLGKLLRDRYDKFLGPTLNYGDVYAVSSDFDRTKMSLELVLRGLYPPVGDNNNEINVVPVIYLPRIVDAVFLPLYCRRYAVELIKLKQSPGVNKFITTHKNFFDYLSKNTGVDMSQDPILQTVYLYHLLTSQKSMGIPLPDWATEEIQDEIEKVAILDYELQSYTPHMKRMYGGHLVKEVINNMEANNTKNRGNKTKIWLYSGHDINVAAFAKTHGLSIPVPYYGATVIVEKWRLLSQEFVQVTLGYRFCKNNSI